MITVISASPRRSSRSRVVCGLTQKLLVEELGRRDVGLIDLAYANLPAWVENGAREQCDFLEAWVPISAQLHASTGFVFVTPEWGGMAPPTLKNLFLLCDETTELSDKPALIVGVSSNVGGAYAVAELRASSYKNTRVCYIPEQVLVHGVNELFDEGELVNSASARTLKARLIHALALLLTYAEALTQVRASAVRDREVFRFGM